MARDLDLGNHRDEPLGGVFNHVAHFVLSEESAVGLAILSLVAARGRRFAYASHLRQPRILLYFDTPTLILGKMPVELVDLVHGQNVEHILDFIDGEDVAPHVEHKAPICEIGFVAYLAGGNPDTCTLLGEGGHG